MGNQQVTDFELGWISGIIDGEGCFTMSPGSHGSWNVAFKLVNTSVPLIERFAELFDKLGIEYHIYNSTRSDNQRPAKRLEVNGPKRLKHMLDLLIRFIVDKEEQAIMIHEWCKKRVSTSYGEMCPVDDQFVYKTLRIMKLSGTSTTTRETS